MSDFKKELEKYSSMKGRILQFDKDIAYALNKKNSFIAYKRESVHSIKWRTLLLLFFKTRKYTGIYKYLNQPVFISSVTQRIHYVQLIKNITAHLPQSEIYFPKSHTIRYFSIKNILKSGIWLIKNLINKPEFWKSKEVIALGAEMCLFMNTADYFQNQYSGILKSKKLLCFDASFGDDATFIYLFKRLNIPTYSLQHSFFFDFKEFIPEEIIKYDVNYPDYYLFWSQKQLDLVVDRFNASPKQLLVAGNPKPSSFKCERIPQTFKKCLVLLSRFYYHLENLKLLNELSKIKDIHFEIRPHPSLKEIPDKIDFNTYIDKCERSGFLLDNGQKTLIEKLSSKDYDFCICFNTAAYFDSLEAGLICFRYSYHENESFEGGMEDQFKDAKELVLKIEKIKQESQNTLLGQIEQILNDELNIHQFKYPEII